MRLSLPNGETLLVEGMCIPYSLYHVELWFTGQFSLTDTSQPESHKNQDRFFPFIKHWAVHFHQGLSLASHRASRGRRWPAQHKVRTAHHLLVLNALSSQRSNNLQDQCIGLQMAAHKEQSKQYKNPCNIPAKRVSGLVSARSSLCKQCWWPLVLTPMSGTLLAHGMGNKTLAKLNSVDCPAGINQCQS